MPACENCGNTKRRRRKCPACNMMLCDVCSHETVADFPNLPDDLAELGCLFVKQLCEASEAHAPEGQPLNGSVKLLLVTIGMARILQSFLQGTKKPRPVFVEKLMNGLDDAMDLVYRLRSDGKDLFTKDPQMPKETIQ